MVDRSENSQFADGKLLQSIKGGKMGDEHKLYIWKYDIKAFSVRGCDSEYSSVVRGGRGDVGAVRRSNGVVARVEAEELERCIFNVD